MGSCFPAERSQSRSSSSMRFFTSEYGSKRSRSHEAGRFPVMIRRSWRRLSMSSIQELRYQRGAELSGLSVAPSSFLRSMEGCGVVDTRSVSLLIPFMVCLAFLNSSSMSLGARGSCFAT